MPQPPPNTGNCDPCQASPAKQGQPPTPNPIDPGSGNENWNETDYRSSDGRLVFTRSFNSSDPTIATVFSVGWQNNFTGRRILQLAKAQPQPLQAVFVSSIYSTAANACTQGGAQITGSAGTYSGGNQCTLSNGSTALIYFTDPAAAWNNSGALSGVAVQRPDGSLYRFACSNGACTSDSNVPLKLTASSSGYTLTDEDDAVESYDTNGVLQSVIYRGGYQQTFTYTSGGQLQNATDSLGRSLSFTFSSTYPTLLQSVATPDGNITYEYDGHERLATVTYPDNSVRTYQYTNTSYTNLLTGIVDEIANPYLVTSYDSQGRALQSGLSGGVLTSSIDYTDPTNPKVTDAFGVQRTYHYTTINSYQKISSISGSSCFTCNAAAATTYDPAGYYQSMTDWNGNVTNYTYDDTRGLELSRVEAVGTQQQRTISTTWDPNFRLPDEIDEPGRKTNYTYDGSGNLLTKKVQDTSTGATRTWTYSNYTAWGAPQTIQGPRTDLTQTTQIAYYPIASGTGSSGQINTITDALGHVTTVNSYDPSGRPLQITDPNGLVTNLTYTPRGWLATSQAGSQLTQYSYYPTGLLEEVILPSGASLTYSYNAAHQLTQVVDQLGDKIVYTPDVMGNVTAIQVYNPSGTLVQTHSRVYNTLNELYQDVGAQNQTTTYTYDNNGNLKSVSDPLSHVTGYGYDALNRLATMTQPNQGVAQYAYNALDQLTGVTDPRTLATTYTVDALGNTNALGSPDSGASSSIPNAAGDVVSRTDAKGQTTTYQYDALDRLIQLSRSDGTTATYTWDQTDSAHGAGIGRLTHVADSMSSSTLDFQYDVYGHVIQRTAVESGVTLVTAYSYDATTGHLTGMTMPSGKLIGYTWTNGQITALTQKGSALVSSIVYQPFGGPISWTLANGETATRTYDQDGRISADPVENVGFDASSRITGITLANLSQASGSQTFGYWDPMNWIDSYTGPGDTITYNYDLNGNRNKQVVNGVTNNYQIDTASNRIVNGTNFLYDANGSMTAHGTLSFAYDASNRVSSGASASTSGAYLYDGLNERAQKTSYSSGNVSNTFLFNYDEAGHLVGQYSTSGTAQDEIVYLGDMPLALLRDTGTATTWYIHADYRNAPRQIDNGAKQAVWLWTPRPFGDNLPNNNPNNLGAFGFSWAFPGQYFDGETSTSYNGYRTYWPTLGHYLQADPIGLAGGSFSTYAYVDGNPISETDPEGLQGGVGVMPGWLSDPIAPITSPIDPAVPIPDTGQPPPNDPFSQRCVSLANKIENVRKEIYDKRIPDLENNPGNLPERIGPGELLRDTVRGHRILLDIQLYRYRSLQDQYDKECAPKC